MIESNFRHIRLLQIQMEEKVAQVDALCMCTDSLLTVLQAVAELPAIPALERTRMTQLIAQGQGVLSMVRRANYAKPVRL